MKQARILFFLILFPFTSHATDIPPEPATGYTEKAVTYAKEYMVVSGNPLASEAGTEMIAQGGTSIDAAIAVQMVLNVVEPQASGIGGGAFMLFYNKTQGHITAYDGRELSPYTATEDMFLKDGKPIPFLEALKGGLSVGTPGVLRMLELAHKEQGKLPWKTLFEPAIKVASEGFPLSPRVRKTIAFAPYISESPEARALFFTEDGKIKPVGSLIKNPKLAETFKTIAENGAGAFYEGEIADAIIDKVQHSKSNPGRLTQKDLTDYVAVKREAICKGYREDTLCTMPPPTSGGITILQTLAMLEHFDISKENADSVHLITEASKLAFADRNKYIADCDVVPVPVEPMLSKDYLAERSKLIKPDGVLMDVKPGVLNWDKRCGEINNTEEHPSTTHISIIDKQGNAISMTSSIEYAFGSGMMVNGFFLNNQLTDFSFLPEINGEKVANRVEPHKRPRSSMSPFLVFDEEGELKLVIGSPGGVRIIPYVLQSLIGVLDWGMNMNEAINQPHFANIGGGIDLEEATMAEALEAKGHEVRVRDLNSGLHGIGVEGGLLASGVDKRREGGAAGE